MRVFVYYNLHKHCYSIKSLEGSTRGKVIDYRDEVDLINVEFKVSEKGRQRVIKEQKKNVHAGVIGDLVNPMALYKELKQVYYNPYTNSTFVEVKTNKPIKKSEYALLKDKKVFAVI